MNPPLHILVVDDRPDSVLFLTEFLLSRKHRVATVGNAKDALSAIMHRRTASDPYDLVITELNLHGMDGLALLRDLRRRQEPIELAICTAYAAMHPNLQQEADRLGCLAVLDKPADLLKVEEIVTLTAGRKRAAPGTTNTSEQPFFGTSRTVRAAEVKTGPLHRRDGEPGTGLERRNAPSAPPREEPTARDAKYPSPLPFDEPSDRIPKRQVQSFSHDADAPTPPEQQPASARVERTGSGREVRPPSAIPVAPEAIELPRPSAPRDDARADAAPGKPLAPVTTRLRRTITGTERITRSPSPPADGDVLPANSRAVACALCGKAFAVVDKAATYSVVCVHCGQVNRIDPLS